MPWVLIVHHVDDYAAWKAVFDGAADLRRQAGEVAFQVLRSDRDRNRIVHFSQWLDLEAARRFFESEELVEIRRRAGVRAPEFLYLEELDRGVL